MRRIALKYTQYNQVFYSTTLNYSTLNSIAEVLEYGDNPYGYQRALDKTHLKRMVASLKSKEVLSPTSIILGVNEEFIEKIVSPINDSIEHESTVDVENAKYINFDLEITHNKFRIIDGQHRLAAFRKYIENLEEHDPEYELMMNKYTFSVIIVLIKDENRSAEVEMFRSINSKAKRLKLDLAMLAEYKYQILEKKKDIDYIFHIKTRVIYSLINDRGEECLNCWINGIKVDVAEKNPLGIVGYKAFYDSIDKILKLSYFDVTLENMKVESRCLNDEKRFALINSTLDGLSKSLVMDLLIPAWEMVHAKWTDAFKEKDIVHNGEIERVYYNNDYYIQQTMGVYAINNLISEVFEKEGSYKAAVKEFSYIIGMSKLTSQSWKKKGLMRGLSSEAGFRIIKSMIKNEIYEE
ncbi:DGQHR domain-containing protein [Listeria booriae]|uniref:DGQHR domain-containing protein n=1 Tax=Listeria booriae TaxID=1552123 RepID=UPI001628A6E5|nr:DGQHR domain-containing protein [Listeria booriae]MBC2024612.1 DGQHR domain-containing protein [Listeria booriae]